MKMTTQDKLLIALALTFILFVGLNAFGANDITGKLFKDVQKYELEMEGLQDENDRYRSEKGVLDKRVLVLDSNIADNKAIFQKLEGKRDAAAEYLKLLTEGLEKEK